MKFFKRNTLQKFELYLKIKNKKSIISHMDNDDENIRFSELKVDFTKLFLDNQLDFFAKRKTS